MSPEELHKQYEANYYGMDIVQQQKQRLKEYNDLRKTVQEKLDKGLTITDREQLLYNQTTAEMTKIVKYLQDAYAYHNKQYPVTKPASVNTQQADSRQVKKQASVTQNPTPSAIQPVDDYVQPREKQIKKTINTSTEQQARIVGKTKEELKKSLEANLEADTNDPSSLSNVVGMQNSAVSNRQLADSHQAEMIKKYVPALTTTTAANNDRPKKPSTTMNYTTTNEEKFNDEVSIIDREWISSRFLVPNTDLMPIDRTNRFFSTTGWKINSTQLGANLAINARPQFTRYADIRGNNRNLLSSGLASFASETFSADITLGMTHSSGIGRYYSESIDDNATLVFLEFGVPKFNNLFSYFTRAITYEDMYIANHGTTPTGYTLGQAVGAIFNLYFFPLTTIIIYGFKAIMGLFLGGPLDYYYFNSAMPQYWAVANNILNKMAVELGLILPEFGGEGSDPHKAQKIGAQATIDSGDFKILSEIIPGAFYPSTNYIDLSYIAARPQILANKQAKAEYEAFKSKPSAIPEFIGYITDGSKWLEKNGPGQYKGAGLDNMFKLSNLTKFFKDWVTKPNSEFSPIDPARAGESVQTVDKSGASSSDASTQNSTYPDGAIRKTPGLWSSLSEIGGKVATNLNHKAEVFDAVTREGAKYAVFAVDFQGAVSESVSNSYSDIELSGMLKGMGGAARNAKFNLSGGNLIPGMAEIGDMLKNFAMGALDSITFGLSNVISTLLGNAFVTFPKKWDDSELSFPQVTYNITLVSPYGNTISQLQNIYIPLAMLLAGSLPLAAGERSYTSPFLCQLFNKGVQNIRLGMITSLSISRGSSNLPFNRWKKPLAVEVSFTVTDFSTVMAAPVNSSIFGGEFNLRLNQDNKFDEYIGVLCGKDLHTDLYFVPKLKKKISRMALALTQTFAGSNSAVSAGSATLVNWIGMFTKERNIGSNQSNNIYF